MDNPVELKAEPSQYDIPEADCLEYFRKWILPGYLKLMHSVEFPRLAVVSGPPGSGKSFAIKVLKEQLKIKFAPLHIKYELMHIDTDRLRLRHPRIDDIQRDDNLHMSEHTNAVANIWKRALLYLGRISKSNVIYEHPLHLNEFIEKTIREYKASGYGVDLHCIAVNSKESVQGVLTRYADEEFIKRNSGRLVYPLYHHMSYAAFPENAQRLEDQKLVDTIAVYSRNTLLFKNTLNNGVWEKPDHVIDIINAERNRIWTQEEKTALTVKWEKYIKQMQETPGFAKEILNEALPYAEEARLFARAEQATVEHSKLSGVVSKISPHHYFVQSGEKFIAFDRDPMQKPDYVEGDNWLPRTSSERITNRKSNKNNDTHHL